ncbi:MAG: DUF1254 domain-containing protein [Micrococcales bacterium]|nr:DUF1254 domain-containing protein [Micrococcales bacterium]
MPRTPRITALWPLLAAALIVSLSACSGQDNPPKAGEGQDADWSVVFDAYTYVFPLVMMDATRETSTNTVQADAARAPINQISHSDQLVDASYKTVVTPNVDTVYSKAWLDLSQTAMVFHKPEADRFLSVELLDAYTNSAAILGTGGDTQEARTYALVGPSWTGSLPDDLTRVDLPTESVFMVVRTLVKGEADLVNVRALQDQMWLMPLADYSSGFDTYQAPDGAYSAESDFVPVEHVLSLSPQEFFDRANALLALNPPPGQDEAALTAMEGIGVGPDLAFDAVALGSDYQDRWQTMLDDAAARWMEQSQQYKQQWGAWEFFGAPIAEFGTSYAFRALVALDGLGANPVSVAIYPMAPTDDAGEILDGTNNYVVHFAPDQLPPVEQYGFWSVTAYGEDDFLIDNELGRYSINDRSEFVLGDDGALDILVQAERPSNEAMVGNWLPVKQEQFHLYLRIYLPAEAAQNGSWSAPSITVSG